MNARVFSIESAGLVAEISELGAELRRLRDVRGRDFLWDGDPAFWSGCAPLLFPIVGRVADDRILVDGRRYSMRQHGFARRSAFEPVEIARNRCSFALRATDETRAAFPFEFRLVVDYALAGDALTITARVFNDDPRAMPVSFGFHPAFRWPLPGAAARADHAIAFERDEPAPIRRLVDGLIAPDAIATPVEGRCLALRDELFLADALVFDRLASRRVAYSAPGAPTIQVAFPDMPDLGVWTKPGAGFVCIEPWQGYASPVVFDGEFARKPGVVSIPPGEARCFAMTISILG